MSFIEMAFMGMTVMEMAFIRMNFMEMAFMEMSRSKGRMLHCWYAQAISSLGASCSLSGNDHSFLNKGEVATFPSSRTESNSHRDCGKRE